MARRQPPLPRLWLMTDPRMPDVLRAVARLPRGSGVVVRHQALEPKARAALIDAVGAVARRRASTVTVAGRDHDGVQRRGRTGFRSASVHSLRELARAHRLGVDVIFVSPLFPTRSHPGAPTLGPLRAAAIVRRARVPAIALGGMTKRRWRRVRRFGFYGWAAIDALS